jgi:polyphosphate kinase
MAPGSVSLSTSPLARVEGLSERALYFNRQLSWLKFNWRVLCQALDQRQPLLERVKFLAIFASNLDEFFMIRVSGLRRQLAAGVVELSQDGMPPSEQMAAIRRDLLAQLAAQEECWQGDVLPKLHAAGIRLLGYAALTAAQKTQLRDYFTREIYPVLTPLAFDPSHPFPHISNLSLNLAVVINDPEQGERFARLKVPDVFPRMLPLPDAADADDDAARSLAGRATGVFVWLEDVIAANLDLLFPGMEVADAYAFRVTRDADLEIEEDEASDLLETIEESIEMRDFGSEVRLEVDRSMPARIRELLVKNLRIAPYLVYMKSAPLGMADLMALLRLERPDLKDAPFVPTLPTSLVVADDLFTAIRQRDILLYHPYHSFTPVVDFVREAARDPKVLAIKQALYRLGPNSPIIDALMEARENGKQVAVLVELKARFDEENNIAWARALEQAGVHVVYGLLGLKTHAKMCLVVRRERDGIVRYVHLGTGNYNPITARMYTDLGLFTCDPEIGADVSDLFNALTGYSRKSSYRKLLVAPGTMRAQILERIEREITLHRQQGDGHIIFKMNSLVDPACIQALYRAAQAGVQIDLQIRGICCLRPGVPGISENIRVTSIVGRFLEHSRIYYFRNGGEQEILLGSADLMPRNLDHRVETIFPINDPQLRDIVLHEILNVHLRDTAQAWRLLPDGEYERIQPGAEETPMNSQVWMMEHASRFE